MRHVLRAGALGRPRGMGWGGRREGVSGWGTHANPWLIHVNVSQKPLQYCRVISLQLIKINGKKKRGLRNELRQPREGRLSLTRDIWKLPGQRDIWVRALSAPFPF